MEKQRMYNADKINGTARHPGTEAKKVSKKSLKRKQEKREKEITELEEARSMGISYGKYRMLKEQGKLPHYIPLPEKRKPQKLGVYVPAKRGLDEFNEAREMMFSVATARIREERRQKRVRAKAMDSTANNYMERMRKQKEAVERAAAGSDQCDS